jgi:recombination associated protein RdgC
MFKNAIIYKLRGGTEAGAQALELKLSANPFIPCGATQEKSVGWVPPREENGLLVESVGGQWIAKLAIETKSVPKSEIEKRVSASIEHIEQTTGRKPGKKERRELKDEALMTLLPNAFAKRKDVLVWINPQTGMLVVGAGSQSAADEVISALFHSVSDLVVSQLNTTRSPQSTMTTWLLGDHIEMPGAFAIERECVLKSNDEDAATVKFTKHNLDNPEVRQHINEGKLPTQLAVSWDACISFVLTESLQLKKIQLLDGVVDASGTDDKDGDRFDADVTIATGTLAPMIAELINAMGGEIVIGETK